MSSYLNFTLKMGRHRYLDGATGRKSVQHIYSHCLGCVLVHYLVSRWVIGLIWQPTIMVYFDPKNGHFWTPRDLEWDLERG